MKGLSILAGVIFLAFTAIAVILVYEMGVPVVEKMQASAVIDRMRASFATLDEMIQEVAGEGKGSKRTVNMRIDAGKLTVDPDEDIIKWDIDTTASIVSPRSKQEWGNVIIGSNLDVLANETTYGGEDAFLLENSRLRVYINKTGTSSSYQDLDTRRLVLAIYQKDLNQWMSNPGFLEVSLDYNALSMTGSGYTALEESGSYLPYGQVNCYIQSDYGLNYYIYFVLDSGADFLQIRVNV
jgi:hypothetical protein